MKKILLIALFAISFKTYGQMEYTFAKSTAAYAPLTGSTVVNNAWAKAYYTKLPFKIKYFSRMCDSLYITPYGLSFTTKELDFISMGQETYRSNVGEISFLIAGSAPNRIVKIQFKDLSVPVSDTSEEYTVNNQIWLYETTNIMEFRFGPNVVTDLNFTEFYFGFRNAPGNSYLAISGTVASPTLFKVLNIGTFKGIAAHPTDGTVYTFTPYVPPSGISNVVKPYTFANSPESFSFKSSQPSTLVLCDLSGKKISEVQLNENVDYQYNYATLAKGMYLVTINSNNQLFTEKIIVQ